MYKLHILCWGLNLSSMYLLQQNGYLTTLSILLCSSSPHYPITNRDPYPVKNCSYNIFVFWDFHYNYYRDVWGEYIMQVINCTVELYSTALCNTVSHHFYFSVMSSDTNLVVFVFKSAGSDMCCKHSAGKALATHRTFLILRWFLWMEH